ncbi:hypothetical protein KCP75_15260 [Salmonella enterica subsp. enterica]|nr:hypothetical protein KCP75_15260 [Salmonella enterica subsp. enterica]
MKGRSGATSVYPRWRREHSSTLKLPHAISVLSRWRGNARRLRMSAGRPAVLSPLARGTQQLMRPVLRLVGLSPLAQGTPLPGSCPGSSNFGFTSPLAREHAPLLFGR